MGDSNMLIFKTWTKKGYLILKGSTVEKEVYCVKVGLFQPT